MYLSVVEYVVGIVAKMLATVAPTTLLVQMIRDARVNLIQNTTGC